MHSAFLTHIASRVFCTDFADQNARFSGEFVKLIAEKFERNGHPFDRSKLEFHQGNAMDFMYRDGWFDLVVSFNAFEHIPDPAQALAEAVRITAPGGLIYITFDPIWACDSGSHFSHRVPAPWQHLLSSDDEYCLMMRDAGAEQSELDEYRTAMNRKRLSVYTDMLDDARHHVDELHRTEWSGVVNEESKEHRNFSAALAKGYTHSDLLTRGISTLLRKR